MASVYTVTASSWLSNVATVTCGYHAIVVNQVVTIAGINPSGYNGAVQITAVTSTTISYALLSNPGSYVSGGTVTSNNQDAYDPTVLISQPIPQYALFLGIKQDIKGYGSNRNASGFGLTNAGWVLLNPKALPGTSYTITAATWSGGYATATVGTHNLIAGQIVSVASASPSGWNVNPVVVSSVGGTTVTYPVGNNPGTWTSGGTVLADAVTPAAGMVAVDPNYHLLVYNGSSWTTGSGATVDATGDQTLPGYLSMPSQPHCRVRRAAALSVVSGTPLSVPWDTDVVDAQMMHSTSSNTDRLIAVVAGDYLVGCSILAANCTTQIIAELLVNGLDTGVRGLFGPETTGNSLLTISYPWTFSLNDYATFVLSQSSGSSVVLTVGAYCSAFMYKIL